MTIKTVQEIKPGWRVKHEFILPFTDIVVNTFVQVLDKELTKDGNFILFLEYQGTLFEEQFKTNTCFIVK